MCRCRRLHQGGVLRRFRADVYGIARRNDGGSRVSGQGTPGDAGELLSTADIAVACSVVGDVRQAPELHILDVPGMKGTDVSATDEPHLHGHCAFLSGWWDQYVEARGHRPGKTLTGRCFGGIIRRFLAARPRAQWPSSGTSNRNTNMIWASYINFMDTTPVERSLCDHQAVTFVYGGSGSYG